MALGPGWTRCADQRRVQPATPDHSASTPAEPDNPKAPTVITYPIPLVLATSDYDLRAAIGELMDVPVFRTPDVETTFQFAATMTGGGLPAYGPDIAHEHREQRCPGGVVLHAGERRIDWESNFFCRTADAVWHLPEELCWLNSRLGLSVPIVRSSR